MRVTKQIEKAFINHSKANTKRLTLQTELYEWVKKQGVDTSSIEFADVIGVRIDNDEFHSFKEFVEDVQRFKNGEDVGYG
ncbi:hypothetical protein ACMGD3_24030 [Lysinibacillus sphaericus]|uniref:hypothetical protein n=1 Tax=Lysinibacillus sphaericus TaxID=1421 RepID=UPI003F7AF321